MSGHNYLNVGLFVPLERDNKSAVDDDLAYSASIGKQPWQLDYYGHNLDFYAGGALMLDDKPEIERAIGLMKTRRPVPSNALLSMARTHQWDEILAVPLGVSPSPYLRYVRGLAFVGKHDLASARIEANALAAQSASALGFMRYVASTLDDMLSAKVAHLDGNDTLAVTRLRGVIAGTSSLPPEAFAPWYYPAGEWLGGILLARGDLAGAEAAFRADLKRTPHNARALYGLMQTLSQAGRMDEARPLAAEIAANWRGPSSDLRLDD
jgi:tetratricopeptide (TPR) repeat protein